MNVIFFSKRFLVLIALIASPSFAQNYYLHLDAAGAALQPAILGEVVRQNNERDQRGSNSNPQSFVSKSTISAVLVQLNYRPSLALRKTNLSKFADQLKIANAADTQIVKTVFTNGDIIAQMNDIMGTFGLRADNVADAYTVWWVSAWQGANGDSNVPTRAQFQAVKAQVASAMASNAELLNSTSVQKQELSEALLVQAAMIDGTIELVKDDPVALRNLQAGIRKGAKSSGVDLDVFDLKPTGFTLSGKVIGAIQKDISPGV